MQRFWTCMSANLRYVLHQDAFLLFSPLYSLQHLDIISFSTLGLMWAMDAFKGWGREERHFRRLSSNFSCYNCRISVIGTANNEMRVQQKRMWEASCYYYKSRCLRDSHCQDGYSLSVFCILISWKKGTVIGMACSRISQTIIWNMNFRMLLKISFLLVNTF